MIYWDNQLSAGNWRSIPPSYLSGRGTIFEQCVDYCLYELHGCNSAAVTFRYYGDQYDGDNCYINYERGQFYYGPICWGSTCSGDGTDTRLTIRMAVLNDFYKQYPQHLPTDSPDGTVGGYNSNNYFICDQTITGFGKANYLVFDKTAHFDNSNSGYNYRNIRESGTNCAARCIERAGCHAFYDKNNTCTFFMANIKPLDKGYMRPTEHDDTEVGYLNEVCPNTNFKSTLYRRSRFYTLVYSPSDIDSVVDDIVTRNTGDPDTPLRVWKFTTENNSPMITSSQYVWIDKPESGSIKSGKLMTISFVIDTNVRVGTELSNRKMAMSNIVTQ